MSIIDDLRVELEGNNPATPAAYQPTEKEQDRLQLIKKAMVQGNLNMYTPRREFNDLSVLVRYQIDKMAWNTYQPNDGQGINADPASAWQSSVVRPVQRNKVISIAAHVLARTMVPMIWAENQSSDPDHDAAQAMEALMKWSNEQAMWPMTALYATITALYSPLSILHTEYTQGYKMERDGEELKKTKDETCTGFIDTMVPLDQLYVENFYEHDLQKQSWLIWRRVPSYSVVAAKYGDYENFKYVQPGVQIVYDDANQGFYNVYDPQLRQELCEEVIFYSRPLDLVLIVVNGVLINDPNTANKREDKKYPFVGFGYEPMDEGKCLYYKSLVFKMQPDAQVINTLYPMIVDRSYLDTMPALIQSGGQPVGTNMIVPGLTTVLDADSKVYNPLATNGGLNPALSVLQKMEEGLSDDSQAPQQMGQGTPGSQTATETANLAQNANTILGLFVQMEAYGLVKPFGDLRITDILQYCTLGEASDVIGNDDLAYKVFTVPPEGASKGQKLQFDPSMPTDPQSPEAVLEMAYQVLQEQEKSGMTLMKANPTLFRKIKYRQVITPDVMNPISEQLEHAFGLEAFDRMIMHPELFDPKETGGLLLDVYPQTRQNKDRFEAKQQPMDMGMTPQPGSPQTNPMKPTASPLQTVVNARPAARV